MDDELPCSAFRTRLLLGVIVATAMLAPDCALADGVIDRGVKPYFILGGSLAALLFLGIGFFLLSKALHHYRMAAMVVQWPIAEGTVVAAEVVKRIATSDDEPDSYIPRVSYAFRVNGIGYQGNVIRIGLDERGYISEQQARDHLARYPAGASIGVRYDPKRPEIAVLEIGQVGATRYLIAGGLLAAVGVGAVVFAIWSATLPVR